MRMRYKISILTLQNNTLTFTVSSYDVVDGFVMFTDEVTREKKRFHGSRCEIKEVGE